MRILLPLLIAALSAQLRAGGDWVFLRQPLPLAPGQVDQSLSLSNASYETWSRGPGWTWMTDTGGVADAQRVIRAELALTWQASERTALQVAAPWVMTEFAPLAAKGQVGNFRLDDPLLHRGQGLGDVRLAARSALKPGHPAWNLAWLLELVAPSGLGPFESSHPLAATGGGRWQVLPGFVAGGHVGAVQGWLQVRGLAQLGKESVLPQAAVSYAESGPVFPPAGALWLGPRYGGDATLGLAWDWYQGEGAAHSIGVELRAECLSALQAGGEFFGDTQSSSLGLVPQLHMGFGRFHAVAGWQAPYLLAWNLPYSDYGVVHLRMDYAF